MDYAPLIGTAIGLFVNKEAQPERADDSNGATCSSPIKLKLATKRFRADSRKRRSRLSVKVASSLVPSTVTNMPSEQIYCSFVRNMEACWAKVSLILLESSKIKLTTETTAVRKTQYGRSAANTLG